MNLNEAIEHQVTQLKAQRERLDRIQGKPWVPIITRRSDRHGSPVVAWYDSFFGLHWGTILFEGQTWGVNSDVPPPPHNPN